MSPTSLSYLLLLAGAALAHQLLPPCWRNLFLLGVSWCFYLFAAPDFFPLLVLSIGVNYLLTRRMQGEKTRRRALLTAGLLFDFGVLFLFKYLQFTGAVLSVFLTWAGLPALSLPAFVQPLGVSFYTFTVTGCLIDAYRGGETEARFSEYALFVSFFPAILSGPIVRSRQFLPQLRRHGEPGAGASWEMVQGGITRILIGLAKKLLLADQLAVAVNTVYAAPEAFSGPQTIAAALAYTFQIYCDFSAYSDMAVGAGYLFGIALPENFNAPYLAASVRDFWRRWHISLSTWFRDYLYFPLGGSRRGTARTCWNLLVVFAVSGLWHGAAMHFVLWGLLHGVFQVGEHLWSARTGKRAGAGGSVPSRLRTFFLCAAAWVFFRADSAGHALSVFRQMAVPGPLFPLSAMGLPGSRWVVLAAGLAGLFLLDRVGGGPRLQTGLARRPWLRWGLWTGLLLAVLLFGAYGTAYDPQEFLYFKF